MEWNNQLTKWQETISLASTMEAYRSYKITRIKRTDATPAKHNHTTCFARNMSKEVMELIKKSYERLGYKTDFLNDISFIHNTLTIMLCANGKLAGTYSIHPKTHDKLFAEKDYFEELDKLSLHKNKPIIELCRFAVDHDLETNVSQHVIGNVLNMFCLIFNTYVKEAPILIMEVNPKHVLFWHALGWQNLGEQKWCHRVNAASQLIWADWADIWPHVVQSWQYKNYLYSKTAHHWAHFSKHFIAWDDMKAVVSRIYGPNHPHPWGE